MIIDHVRCVGSDLRWGLRQGCNKQIFVPCSQIPKAWAGWPKDIGKTFGRFNRKQKGNGRFCEPPKNISFSSPYFENISISNVHRHETSKLASSGMGNGSSGIQEIGGQKKRRWIQGPITRPTCRLDYPPVPVRPGRSAAEIMAPRLHPNFTVIGRGEWWRLFPYALAPEEKKKTINRPEFSPADGDKIFNRRPIKRPEMCNLDT